MNIRIYYEDTDCGGIVYHANYLKFCERARSEVFFKQNQSPQSLEGGFVVRSMHANFHKSAFLGDLIHVKTKVLEIKKVSLLLHQEVFRDDELLFEMEVKLGFVDFKKGKPSAIPEKIMEVLCKL
ncbi:YbgC/FadM family acyl-CoA thioesterase [Helicobacter pametensis]|uniref:YbgC/FadM family acyl-CoA thioesterase n=1 Tax=Helicobacter pametensis TaxID=95149 RepID=UPI0004839487|nr:YbgC/FadM family acyl-CoA thioesterase [Helicobacter pametensis]